MSNKKPFEHKARRDAILSIQFYRDKEGTPAMLISSNPEPEKEAREFSSNSFLFARNLINCELLCFRDLVNLIQMFEYAKKEMGIKLS